MDFDALIKIAIEAAIEAGNIIKRYQGQKLNVGHKSTGTSIASQVVTKVDLECETAIIDKLKQSCTKYDLALLSEETEDDGLRFEKEFFWCIDPIDGTLAFINDRDGYCVSIALVSKAGESIIGVVYDPRHDNLYHAIKGKGVYKNNQPFKNQKPNAYLTYVTDVALKDSSKKTITEEYISKIANENKLESFKEISGGGLVFNAITVLENGPACLFKFPKPTKGGGCIWDYAAITCIFNESGLPATDFNGNDLELNKKDGHYMNQNGAFFSNL